MRPVVAKAVALVVAYAAIYGAFEGCASLDGLAGGTPSEAGAQVVVDAQATQDAVDAPNVQAVTDAQKAQDAATPIGAACSASTECGSGNCVDSVCCSSASCPACRSCGPTGLCDVVIGSPRGLSDPTPTLCEGDSTCNATGVCVPRWTLVATDVGKAPGWLFAVGSPSSIYYASETNAGTQFLRRFDVTPKTVADEGLANNDLCACGYTSVLVYTNAPGTLNYIAGSARSYLVGQSPLSSWVAYPTYPLPRGEPGITPDGVAGHETIYMIGGRSDTAAQTTDVQTYDTLKTSWSTIAPTPIATYQICAGSIGGKVYAFGGKGAGNAALSSMFVYDTANTGAGWTPMASIKFACTWETAYVWGTKLAVRTAELEPDAGPGTTSIQVFDPATGVWEVPIPFPSACTTPTQTSRLVVAQQSLYALCSVGTDLQIFRYGLE